MAENRDDKIVELYLDGESVQTIAAMVNLSRRRVYDILRLAGVVANRRGGRPKAQTQCRCVHCGQLTIITPLKQEV